MARVNAVKGVKQAFRDVRKRHAKGMEIGLKRAGLFLQAKSQAIVPVEFGVLKASAFTRKEGRGLKTVVIVGYTAAYAVYVHENLEVRHGADFNAWHGETIAANAKRPKRKRLKGSVHNDRGPNQQAKFLEQPARVYRREMAQMVVLSMRDS